MKKFKKPDLNAPRFRNKSMSILNSHLLKDFKKRYPEYKNLSIQEFKKIIKVLFFGMSFIIFMILSLVFLSKPANGSSNIIIFDDSIKKIVLNEIIEKYYFYKNCGWFWSCIFYCSKLRCSNL